MVIFYIIQGRAGRSHLLLERVFRASYRPADVARVLARLRHEDRPEEGVASGKQSPNGKPSWLSRQQRTKLRTARADTERTAGQAARSKSV
jgi:hypothetical protein